MNKIAIFILALISGVITQSGIMTVEQFIWSSWESTSESLLFSLSPDFHIYIIIFGIVVFCIVAYYAAEPFIHGLFHGVDGFAIAISGFVIGWVLMIFVTRYCKSLFGLPM